MASGKVFDAIFYAENKQKHVDETAISEISENAANKKSYAETLKHIRSRISENNATDLISLEANATTSGDGRVEQVLKNMIVQYLQRDNIVCTECTNFGELTQRLFEDMAGFGFLTPYIYDPDVEEININSWNDIEIIDGSGEKFRKLDTAFQDPQQCIDIVKKMIGFGGVVIDGSQPVKDSFIFKGVRISAMVPPVIDEELGAVASIRRQKTKSVNKEMLIDSGELTEDEFNMLLLCLNNGISVLLAGSTGSGKTTFQGCLLYCVDNDKRIYTIEDSRELNLIKYGEDGLPINRIIHTKTHLTDNPKTSITMDALLKQALRQHPDIIVPAEMRGKEAWTAQECGRTGHTIITTLHANSAAEAYTRVLTMCQEANTNLSEDLMMKMIMAAFPIVVQLKQLDDGSRKVMEIIEPYDYTDGKLRYHELYKYVTKGWADNEDGKRYVVGEHRLINHISDGLATRLLENGADLSTIKRFADPKWNPEKGGGH